MHKRLLAGMTAALALGASAGASAATVTDIGSAGAVYSARHGEVNRLRVDRLRFTGQFTAPFTEFSAPLTTGEGCTAGTPVLCLGTDLVTVHLGDRNDVAYVDPFFGIDVHVYAGEGDDDVWADALGSTVDGGPGDDILRLNADGGAHADGGPGDDQIAGHLEGGDQFDGGTGNDLIVATSPYTASVRGQEGNDTLLGRAGQKGGGTLAGNDGDDLIAYLDPSAVGGYMFDGGRGDDVINGAAASVDAGPGDDRIDVVGSAAGSAVTCGKGTDTVWADSADIIGADCERVIRTDTPQSMPGITDARARAQVLLAHRAQPDPNAG